MNEKAKSRKQFIQAFQLGEERAFDFFFRKYYAALCFFASSYLNDTDAAEDVVQECFVKLWSRHTVMRNPDAIKSFLYTSVRNACLNELRKQRLEDRSLSALTYLGETMSDDDLNEVTRAETIRQVHAQIQELPPRIQQVFRMFYLEGKNYSQIAHELQTSPETVRKQKARALVLLREKLLPFFVVLLFFI